MSRLAVIAALGAGVFLAAHSTNGASPSEEVPRGIRNNNPGNIRKGESWRGLAVDQSADPEFAVFSDPVWGIRALARVLNVYRSRDGLPGLGGPGVDTIQEVISRWAPDSENDTAAYVRSVVKSTGIPADRRLQKADYPALVKAIIQHENGVQPYPDAIIYEGIERAIA